MAYWLTGLGAVLVPFALRWRGALVWLAGAALTIGALLFLWVSLVSYFGHIALS